MRAKAISKYDFQSFEFSEIYPFFWDQLEKANLFLQGIIDTSKNPMSDKTVEWLFQHPLSDGGTFTECCMRLSRKNKCADTVIEQM